MRIAHIITRLIVGGAQENTLLSCQGQHAAGHEVTLLTGPPIGPEGSLLERARSEGYRIEILDDLRRAIHPARDWRSYETLVRRLRQLKPDIVHTHSSKAGIIGRWAACRAGGPAIIHTIHGLAFTASTSRAVNSVYRVLEARTAPITHRIAAVAQAMIEQSLAARIGRPEQYAVVYSGMETEPFLHPPVSRDIMRQQLGLRPDDVAVGTIARLFDLKGHDDLLHLAPRLCARLPNLRFLWIGDGSLRPRFEASIRAMNLADRFILTGLVPPARIPELAGAMDILVHPSRREGLARALPQGSLAARPVITYDVDGNAEAVLAGQSGLVIPPFDRERLGDAIERLAVNADLRRSMGETGRAFALRRFGKDTMIAALEKLYVDALSARHQTTNHGQRTTD